MIHKLKRWIYKRKYNEAYLDYDGKRITEEKKVGRVEIGPTAYKEEDEFVTVVKPYNKDNKNEEKTKESNDLPPEVEEDQRVVDKPKSKVAFIMPLFWLLLLGTTLHYFIPFTQEVLSKDIQLPTIRTVREQEEEQPENNDTESIPDEIDVVEDVKEEDAAESNDKNIDLDFNAALDKINENIPVNIEADQDMLSIYANVHATIVEQTRNLRNTTQDYVTGNARHVQMSSLGGRINMRMSQAQGRVERFQVSELQTTLLRRIERLKDISRRTSKFDREEALSEINAFLTEENADSQRFVEDLIQALEESGRSYTIEEGLVKFN